MSYTTAEAVRILDDPRTPVGSVFLSLRSDSSGNIIQLTKVRLEVGLGQSRIKISYVGGNPYKTITFNSNTNWAPSDKLEKHLKEINYDV